MDGPGRGGYLPLGSGRGWDGGRGHRALLLGGGLLVLGGAVQGQVDDLHLLLALDQRLPLRAHGVEGGCKGNAGGCMGPQGLPGEGTAERRSLALRKEGEKGGQRPQSGGRAA